MEAIQIKYLGVTDRKPSRLKAWSASGESIIEEINYQVEISHQALRMARDYIKKLGWEVEVVGFGTLPNGDYVATVE